MKHTWLGKLFGVALLIGIGCNTPTIPIPPLGAPSFQQLVASSWNAHGGGASKQAQVFVINRMSGDGVTTQADDAGNYATGSFAGQNGDTVELFYRTTDGHYSDSICTHLAAGTQQGAACP